MQLRTFLLKVVYVNRHIVKDLLQLLRCSLDVETENLYLYVYFNMPVLSQWDPRPAIVKQIETKNRRNKTTDKAQDQSWFNGIFHKNETQNEKKENENIDKKEVLKKNFLEKLFSTMYFHYVIILKNVLEMIDLFEFYICYKNFLNYIFINSQLKNIFWKKNFYQIRCMLNSRLLVCSTKF